MANIAYGAGAVWVTRVANGGGVLWRIDPSTGAVRRVAGPNGPIVVGAGAVWVPNGAGTLTKVDSTRCLSSRPTGPRSTCLKGRLSVPDNSGFPTSRTCRTYTANAGTAWGVDLFTGNVTRVVVGGGALAAAFGSGAVWVACSLSGTVVRVDPSSEAVVQTIQLNGMPSGLAFTKNGLWVSVS